MDLYTFFDSIIYYFVQTLIVLGTLSILVFLHEFGHFIAARLSGVDVLEFSFGMGKLLFNKKIKNTDYQIRLIPMGGFVKLAGEESIQDPDYLPQPNEFYGVSPLKRIGIVFAGPFMNLVLAFFTFWATIYFLGETLTKPIVGYISENSVAYEKKLKSGDEIKSINQIPIESYEQIDEILSENIQKRITIEVLRENKKINIDLVPRLKVIENFFGDKINTGNIGIHPFYKAIVGSVMKDSPAEKIGIRQGDVIQEIQGKKNCFLG